MGVGGAQVRARPNAGPRHPQGSSSAMPVGGGTFTIAAWRSKRSEQSGSGRRMHMLGPNFQQLNRLHAASDAELGEMVRAVLRLLRPQRLMRNEKIRLGSGHDGAYVMMNDFTGVDTALSFGINDNIEWDKVIADKGIRIHQFDHTVEDPAPHDPRMVFNKTMIATEVGPGQTSIEALVREQDRGDERPNMILKMDIEGWEWPVLEQTSLEAVQRFGQIVGEFHCFDYMSALDFRQTIFRGLRKISKFYAPIHVHANNYAGWKVIGGVPVPAVVEICFVNRSLYPVEESDETFPTDLDRPCDPNQADMWLGRFEY
jgi:hypothetical protein